MSFGEFHFFFIVLLIVNPVEMVLVDLRVTPLSSLVPLATPLSTLLRPVSAILLLISSSYSGTQCYHLDAGGSAGRVSDVSLIVPPGEAERLAASLSALHALSHLKPNTCAKFFA